MVEVCSDLLIRDLNELKSKTCNTMWSKLHGCTDCKFNVILGNKDDSSQRCNFCLITIMTETVKMKDARKIKGVY